MAGMSLLGSAAVAVSRLQPFRRGVIGSIPPVRSGALPALVPVRFSGHGGKQLFRVKPTIHSDRRFLRLMIFYGLLTGIPAGLAIALINIFIGPAELAEIPEGYVPDHWEYIQHPISRWIARNVVISYEKSYEQQMAIIHMENEKRLLRKYELEARRSMRKNGDGPWHHYEMLDKNLIDNSPKSLPDA